MEPLDVLLLTVKFRMLSDTRVDKMTLTVTSFFWASLSVLGIVAECTANEREFWGHPFIYPVRPVLKNPNQSGGNSRPDHEPLATPHPTAACLIINALVIKTTEEEAFLGLNQIVIWESRLNFVTLLCRTSVHVYIQFLDKALKYERLQSREC